MLQIKILNDSTFKQLNKFNGVGLCKSATFLTSDTIGATSMEQLKENISSIDVKLSEEILKRIDEIQELQPNPAP